MNLSNARIQLLTQHTVVTENKRHIRHMKAHLKALQGDAEIEHKERKRDRHDLSHLEYCGSYYEEQYAEAEGRLNIIQATEFLIMQECINRLKPEINTLQTMKSEFKIKFGEHELDSINAEIKLRGYLKLKTVAE